MEIIRVLFRSCRAKSTHPSAWREADGCLDFARHERHDGSDLRLAALGQDLNQRLQQHDQRKIGGRHVEGVKLDRTHPAQRARMDRLRRAAPFAADIEQQQQMLRSEEHTSELQSLMSISYAVFCLK